MKMKNKLTKIKRLTFSFIPLIVLFLLLELLLYIAGIEKTSDALFSAGPQGHPRQVTFEPSYLKPSFSVPKPSGEFRIFCYGASSMFGSNYADKSSLPKRLETILNLQGRGDKDIRAYNLAVEAMNSDVVEKVIKQSLRYEPDLCVVYMGHNEMGWFRSMGISGPTPVGEAWKWLAGHTRSVSIIDSLLALRYVQKVTRDPGLFFDYPDDGREFFPPKQRKKVLRAFSKNIKDIISICNEHGVPVVFMTVIGNEADYYPIKSVFDSSLGPNEKERILRDLEKADGLIFSGKIQEAEPLIINALEKSPDFALAHFLKGIMQRQRGEWGRAWSSFQVARDLDDLPVRAPSSINEALRKAVKGDGAYLLDSETLIKSKLEGKEYLGHKFFTDHVHQTLYGQQELAEMLIRYLDANDLIPQNKTSSLPASYEEVNEALGIKDDYLAQWDIVFAFRYALLSDRKLNIKHAIDLLTRWEGLESRRFTVLASRGFFNLRIASMKNALADWNTIMREDPAGARKLIQALFPGNAVSIGDYLAIEPFKDVEKFYDFKRVSTKRLKFDLSPFTLPKDPCFLDYFSIFLKWNKISGEFEDVTESIRKTVENRNQVIKLVSGTDLSAIEVNFSNGLIIHHCETSPISGCVTTADDPFFTLSNMDITPSIVNSIEIDMEIECRNPKDLEGYIYWKENSADDYDERNKLQFPISTAKGEKKIILPVANYPDWIAIESIKGIMIVPVNSKDCKIEEYRVIFMPVTAEQRQ